MENGFKSVNQLAKEWEVNPRTVQTMCTNGRIQGAVKVGREWAIPENVEKPVDKRLVSGKYVNWRKKNKAV